MRCAQPILEPTEGVKRRSGQATGSSRRGMEQERLDERIHQFLNEDKVSSTEELRPKLVAESLPESVEAKPLQNGLLLYCVELKKWVPVIKFSLFVKESMEFASEQQKGKEQAEARISEQPKQKQILDG